MDRRENHLSREESVIGPYFKEMGPDTIEFARDDYFLYRTLTTLACLSVGTLRMRDSMPHVARVGGARTVDTERTPSMCNQMYVQRRRYVMFNP